MSEYTKEDLINFEPHHTTLIGIDSDGCVFDTMEVKQKNHFHPLIIENWGLESVEIQLRQAAEFVNLYSAWRGQNRFPALLKTFELLEEWPEVIESGVQLPDITALRTYCESGLSLGNPSLQLEVERTNDPELKRILDWSLAVNRDIDENMESIPPFEWARRSIEKIKPTSDVIVVSQTPEEALVKEWALHEMEQYVAVIAGQELGTKSEHLKMVASNRYESTKIIMIGDAPGDLRAAEAVGAWFYPINPGRENESWERFHNEACGKFIDGTFDAAYQKKLSDEYKAALPSEPPWKQ
jgi:phosphoglycolate phosphatase-like HAD superfamily hydrolase